MTGRLFNNDNLPENDKRFRAPPFPKKAALFEAFFKKLYQKLPYGPQVGFC